jgi:hypothetical protein
MKLRYLLAPLALLAFAYSFSSCTKSTNTTTTIRDTTTIIYKDTIVKKDTVIKIDTLVITNPKNPIVGLWVGTYALDASPSAGSFYYGFSIFPDHTIITQGGGSNGQIWTATGTWSLAADSTFSCDIHSTDLTAPTNTQHITAKYSAVNGTLSNGRWTYTSGGTATGSFSLKRVGDQ